MPGATRRWIDFLNRHRVSLPLSLVSGGFFVELADEMREGELDGFDARGTEIVTQWRGRWDEPMLALTRLGDGEVMAGIVVVAAAWLALKNRLKEAVFVIVSGAGTALINLALKLALQRARPERPYDYLIPSPQSFSFPSGHAMGSTGVLLSLLVVLYVLGLPRRWLLATLTVTILLLLGIGASRVYFGVHYPSDVLGGLLAGAAWVSALTGWFYPRVLPGEHSVTKPPKSVSAS